MKTKSTNILFRQGALGLNLTTVIVPVACAGEIRRQWCYSVESGGFAPEPAGTTVSLGQASTDTLEVSCAELGFDGCVPAHFRANLRHAGTGAAR
ncbi:hypothetical protein [Duganella radicis]|uniref:Uncharacterized protein n=1 Tax=Duganella radicis TaxID=551988 RepID=A0A6L6PAH1_9BURK|nr:hypothetical protein [Duganella radicis]MTV35986.1 hypothetical protein [Duganella radicis]